MDRGTKSESSDWVCLAIQLPFSGFFCCYVSGPESRPFFSGPEIDARDLCPKCTTRLLSPFCHKPLQAIIIIFLCFIGAISLRCISWLRRQTRRNKTQRATQSKLEVAIKKMALADPR